MKEVILVTEVYGGDTTQAHLVDVSKIDQNDEEEKQYCASIMEAIADPDKSAVAEYFQATQCRNKDVIVKSPVVVNVAEQVTLYMDC